MKKRQKQNDAKSLNEMPTITDMEWTLIWMAIRYAMNRQTIACSMLPADIVTEYYHKMTDYHKYMIAEDLKRNEEMSDGKAFGNPNIDRLGWVKFWKLMDTNCHYTVKLVDGSEADVFEAEGRIYPVKQYIEAPFKEIFLSAENITPLI